MQHCFLLCWHESCELTTRMAKFVRWLHSHVMRPVLLSILRILQPSALQFPLPATRETWQKFKKIFHKWLIQWYFTYSIYNLYSRHIVFARWPTILILIKCIIQRRKNHFREFVGGANLAKANTFELILCTQYQEWSMYHSQPIFFPFSVYFVAGQKANPSINILFEL